MFRNTPDNLNQVTPFSRFFAAFLFVTLPFLGFYLGTEYQKSIHVEPIIEYGEVLAPREVMVKEPAEEVIIEPEAVKLGVPDTKTNVYEVNISEKFDRDELERGETSMMPYPSELLATIVGYDEYNESDHYISYDRNNGPFYTTKNPLYYLALVNLKISESNNSYSDDYYDIEFREIDDGILPYLEDPRYCASNSDCMLGNNFCTVGAFNKYHPYRSTWGCPYAQFQTGEDAAGLAISLNCP